MNIVVYLGSSNGNYEIFENEALKLGEFIAKENNTLVYGGSKSGLMGKLALAALENGGDVIGVEPKEFMDDDLDLKGLTKLIVCDDISSRKQKMMELGDVFIAFPGGTGTLEEITEVIARNALGQKNCKCIFYNINGFYNPIKDLFNNMLSNGFSTSKKIENIYFVNDLEQLKKLL